MNYFSQRFDPRQGFDGNGDKFYPPKHHLICQFHLPMQFVKKLAGMKG
jgi:hypothetical protein